MGPFWRQRWRREIAKLIHSRELPPSALKLSNVLHHDESAISFYDVLEAAESCEGEVEDLHGEEDPGSML